MSHVAQRMYRARDAERADDDAMADFAVAEYAAGRLTEAQAISALRTAGRFEAEIDETLRAARLRG